MGMAGIRFPVFLVVLVCMWTLDRADAELCVLKEKCILPCTFPSDTDVVIHWIQLPNTNVHSFYHSQDQFARQDQRFKGRTSLFHNQISNSNASLTLSSVTVEDQGTYRCYTSTKSGNQESFINLKVEDPIRKVNIQEVENGLICSSEGIYPEPEITWTISPPSSMNVQNSTSVQNTTSIQKTKEQLYNINSNLRLPDTVPDLTYTCTVRTSTNRGVATLVKSSPVTGCYSETTIHCGFPNKNHKGLVWTFNHSQRILSQANSDAQWEPSDQWKNHVKEVSESGALILKDLSSEQEGKYTCELNNNEGTHFNITVLTTIKDCSSKAGIIVGVLISVLVVVVGLVVAFYIIWKKKKKNNKWAANPQEEGMEVCEQLNT